MSEKSLGYGKEAARAWFIKSAKKAMAITDEDKKVGCWVYKLARKEGNLWALVVGWLPDDDNERREVYGGLAYQPSNSMLQCDLDFDWRMPESGDPEGDLDETLEPLEDYTDAGLSWVFDSVWDDAKHYGVATE